MSFNPMISFLSAHNSRAAPLSDRPDWGLQVFLNLAASPAPEAKATPVPSAWKLPVQASDGNYFQEEEENEG